MRILGVVAAVLLGLGPMGCTRIDASRLWSSGRTPLVVTRGTLEQRLQLTGELDAAWSILFDVPATTEWNLSIRWLVEDGTSVHAGDRIVEFDNTAVVERIRESELAAIEAELALLEQQAKHAADLEDRRFEVSRQLTAVAKTRLDAELPSNLLSRREARNFAIALVRAEAALATATSELEAITTAGKLEEQVKRIVLGKFERACEGAEQQLRILALTAPRDGIAIIGEHPWEGRKFQMGDNAWPGMTVAKLPDPAKMIVRAKLSDLDEGRVSPGMPVSCIVDAFPERPIAGHIVMVSPVAQASEESSKRRFFAVDIELDEAVPAALQPGLSVRVDVVTHRAEDLLLAPRRALDLSVEPARARLANGRELELELGFCDAQRCAVSGGLTEGDRLRAVEVVP